MDAQLKKIQITPAKFDKDGEFRAVETGQITLAVPLDTKGVKKEFIALFEVLGQEWVTAEIIPRQLTFDDERQANP